jgi:GAF domain-containing protein
MNSDTGPIGVITVTRKEPGTFAAQHIQLLQTFADQAVIAISNVRLFERVQERTRELSEALTYQTGSSNILKVIASSPTDVGPALKAIVESACEICGAYDALVFLKDEGDLVFAAHHGPIPIELERWPINRKWITGRALADKAPQHIHDVYGPEGDDFPEARELARHQGPRSPRTVLAVPLLREGEAIGVIALRRVEVQPFNDKQIELLQSFADQAVIAISNVRLFDEVQAKTRDLSEAFTYQSGSANILKVIASSPTDVEPVLTAIVESASVICEAEEAHVALRDGDELIFRVQHGSAPVPWNRQPINRRWVTGRAAVDRRPVHLHDFLSPEGDEFPDGHELARRDGTRTMLAVPLLREGECIGVIALRRMEVRPFSEKQIELLQTFADQAVIAIGNVHLFDEVQARTHELQETLEYQTAASDVLNIISRSPSNIQPVLETIAETAQRLCHSEQAYIMRLVDGLYHLAAAKDARTERIEYLKNNPIVPSRGSVTGRVAIERQTIQVTDAQQDSEYTLNMAGDSGYRTILGVPLLREGVSIGVIILTRPNVQPFTEKEVELVTTFADQAVIAVENARLLDELRESLQQQTATADVLKVISRSTFDLQTVLQTLVESVARLCDADMAQITRQRDGAFFRAEAYGFSDEYLEYTRTISIAPSRGSAMGRVLLDGTPIHIPDALADPEYTFTEAQRLAGFRAVLAVPMLREGVPIGVIVTTRKEPRSFTQKQIELATTFADQAAIAIGNVQLFDAVQERTHELAKSLNDLRIAQDRLIQTEKLASLGQLTAGIAHEIKNPLNFVNNFAALSVELTDELKGALKPAVLDQTLRADVDEITGLLKDNLGKVVQHGKRADSIVKNMLLHSREGSGEHRPVEINAIIDESLNLAYHGARAEKQGFSITLERDFDPAVGVADIYPQEVTRVLLNLISNGFYAATKRAGATGDGFEPTLKAVTRNLGDRIEVRIRDNGAGIPPDIQEKIFNPFFTTKPAGEGTGLGLSMSHDIVVKQHRGTIEVVTEPGSFTEFIITLPRVMP